MSFCFRQKRIERRRVEYARDSYRDEFFDVPPQSYSRVPSHSYSCASPHTSVLCFSSLMDLTIAHIVLVYERTTLSLDAFITAHALVVVIISRVDLVFLLEGPSPTLSRDTWMVHIFLIVVHVPLGQMVRWKGLQRLLLVTWLSAGFLGFISLTPALSHRPLLIPYWCWTEDWRTCGSWILVAHVS
jgi:lysylphosphatidylglycerol synthetase-like protein (DUF2156 family)